jgi:hypothetical protein
MIFGLPETAASPVAQVKAALRPTGAADVLPMLLEARRLGAKRGEGAHPRPLLVKLATSDAKHRIFKVGPELRAARVKLDDDLTPKQMAIRNSLGADFVQLKEQGLKPFWRYERLFKATPDGGVARHKPAPAPAPAAGPAAAPAPAANPASGPGPASAPAPVPATA